MVAAAVAAVATILVVTLTALCVSANDDKNIWEHSFVCLVIHERTSKHENRPEMDRRLQKIVVTYNLVPVWLTPVPSFYHLPFYFEPHFLVRKRLFCVSSALFRVQFVWSESVVSIYILSRPEKKKVREQLRNT